MPAIISPFFLIMLGIFAHVFRNWTVRTYPSAKWSVAESLIWIILSMSFTGFSKVFIFGSNGQSCVKCPNYLQHLHFVFIIYGSSISIFRKSSSWSSSLVEVCFCLMQPLSVMSCLPQHHQICPPYSEAWVLQLQL